MQKQYLRHTVTRILRKRFPTHFFALWHDIGKYDVSKASFKSYIYGIARNCANNKARRIRKQGKTLPIDKADEAVTNQDVEYDAISKINSDIMLDIISHMKPPQGKVFIYKYIDGMSIKGNIRNSFR